MPNFGKILWPVRFSRKDFRTIEMGPNSFSVDQKINSLMGILWKIGENSFIENLYDENSQRVRQHEKLRLKCVRKLSDEVSDEVYGKAVDSTPWRYKVNGESRCVCHHPISTAWTLQHHATCSRQQIHTHRDTQTPRLGHTNPQPQPLKQTHTPTSFHTHA